MQSKIDYFRDHETVDKDLYVVSNGAEVIIISGRSKTGTVWTKLKINGHISG